MNATAAANSLITEAIPETWQELERIVAAILAECGMKAQNGMTLTLPRGTVDVDVHAEEMVDGIVHRTICEYKYWRATVPKTVVHSFRTVMAEAGVHRGYIISTSGFQAGAIEAAVATNIELVTFEEFQRIYFDKWIGKRIWAIENKLDGFHTYYELLGPPAYSKPDSEDKRTAYDEVWNRYLFAGLMLHPFSPYIRMVGSYPYPPLPFDCSSLDSKNIEIPDDIRNAKGYREFFELLLKYGLEGRAALRAVSSITGAKPPNAIQNED